MKRHSGRCVGLWSEFTHAKGDCKWLSPLQCAPHALKPEGFHRRPAEDCAGTASMTSSLQATASEKKSGVFWKFQKSQVKKGPRGPLVTKVIVWHVRWWKKNVVSLKYHPVYLHLYYQYGMFDFQSRLRQTCETHFKHMYDPFTFTQVHLLYTCTLLEYIYLRLLLLQCVSETNIRHFTLKINIFTYRTVESITSS